MLRLEHPAPEEPGLLAFHGLGERLALQGLVSMEDHGPDLDLRSLLNVEHHPDRSRPGRLGARRDPRVGVAIGGVGRFDLARIQLQGSRVEKLSLGERELLLEGLLLDLLRAVEHDLLHARALLDVDRERNAARNRGVAHRHVREESRREEPPDGHAHLAGVVGLAGGHPEGADDHQGIDVDVSRGGDAPDRLRGSGGGVRRHRKRVRQERAGGRRHGRGGRLRQSGRGRAETQQERDPSQDRRAMP